MCVVVFHEQLHSRKNRLKTLLNGWWGSECVCVCVCLFCHITGCFKRCFSTTEPNQVLARFDLDVLKLKRKRRKSKEAFVGYLFKPQPPEQCVCSLGVARNCLRNILDFFFFFFLKGRMRLCCDGNISFRVGGATSTKLCPLVNISIFTHTRKCLRIKKPATWAG